MNSLLSLSKTTFNQSCRMFWLAKSIRTLSSTLSTGHYKTFNAGNVQFSQRMRRYSDVYYSKKHEYIIMESNLVGRVGISNYAQDKLGDVVYVQLPELDRVIEINEDVAAVESVKAASEVYSPVSGTVTDVNKALETDCGLINKSPLDKGWIFKVSLSDKDELKSLMNSADYEKYLKNEADEDDGHH